MELIKEILNSNLKSPTYYLIIGPDDCGKKFGENFAKAINYAKLDVNLVEWLMNKLSVLIIDDIVKIAKNDLKVVDNLQDIAKTAVDHRLFTVIFIARDLIIAIYDAQIVKRIFDLCGERISHISSVTFGIDKLINLQQIDRIKQYYRLVWEVNVPVNSKQSILQFLCNNLDAEFIRRDIIRLFKQEKSEYIFSTLLKCNLITYNKEIIEFGAPVVKAMFNEL
ncbi:37757_t:CDS:2, partial [Gigaspora margarita]